MSPARISRLGLRVRIAVYVAMAAAMVGLVLPAQLEALFADFRSDLKVPLSPRSLGHYRALKDHLERPFDGYGTADTLVPAFGVVLLSHTACGLMNVALADPSRADEAARLMDEVARRALSPAVSPYGADPRTVDDLGDWNLYLSHLNLILGCRRLLTQDTVYEDLHQRVTVHLLERTLADGDFHAVSYPGSPKFPADQTVTLLSLALYDRGHGTDRSAEAVRGWRRLMREQATDPATGLHRSSIGDAHPGAATPRGCALSWTSLFLAQVAPDEGAALYEAYRTRYFKTVGGCGGFREWPEGFSGFSDVDSGPVILDLGVAATGIGLGAARLYGDADGYAAIMRSASATGLPLVAASNRRYLLAPLLGEAILFHGTTARPWFEPVPPRLFPPVGGFPMVPLGLSLTAAIAAFLCLWRCVVLKKRPPLSVTDAPPKGR